MFEQTFKNIDDILHKDAGCTSELDYTKQSSWLLFLNYLAALEADKATEAALDGKKYKAILDAGYRRESWAAPKTADGKPDDHLALTGDDLLQFRSIERQQGVDWSLPSSRGDNRQSHALWLHLQGATLISDGKLRLTDAATAETLLRLVQSVPSPKAEPIKLWLANVGYERMQEMADPALSLNRPRETWQQHGRSDKWIAQRMTGQETRNKLIDYWREHDIREGQEFAILTNIIHQEWSGLGVKEHGGRWKTRPASRWSRVTITCRLRSPKP